MTGNILPSRLYWNSPIVCIRMVQFERQTLKLCPVSAGTVTINQLLLELANKGKRISIHDLQLCLQDNHIQILITNHRVEETLRSSCSSLYQSSHSAATAAHAAACRCRLPIKFERIDRLGLRF
jgi:hypothetical protein